jgi:hypothetical protein
VVEAFLSANVPFIAGCNRLVGKNVRICLETVESTRFTHCSVASLIQKVAAPRGVKSVKPTLQLA